MFPIEKAAKIFCGKFPLMWIFLIDFHKSDNLWKFPQNYAWNLSTQKVFGKFPQFWFILWKFDSKRKL